MDISIVIPLFNRREYIERTVDSILGSGIAFKNVILVDNGSTDGTLDLIQTFPGRYGPQFVITTESREGAAAARNKGLSLCRSKWVLFFDSDDIFTGLPDGWDEDADMICVPTVMEIGRERKKRFFFLRASPHTQIICSALNTQGMIFKTDFIREIGGWNERCHAWNDWELGIRVLVAGCKVQLIPDKAYHRILIHSDSITGAKFSSNHKMFMETLEVVFEHIYAMEDSLEKNKCDLALFFRVCILCGHYVREGNGALAAELKRRFADRFILKKRYMLAGRFLIWYVAIGGRGAWYPAMKICDCSGR